MAKGIKTGGRRPGSKNKHTTAFKEAVLECFHGMGGVKALITWAKKNPDEFYTKVAPRLIPHEVTHGGEVPLPLKIELTHGATPPPVTE